MNAAPPPLSRRLHPAWWALLAGAVVLVVAFAPAVWSTFTATAVPVGSAQSAEAGAPWAVESLPGSGTRVFGLSLPGATMADARQRWGDGLQLALMASRGQAPALEGMVDNVQLGPVAGRLVFSAMAAPQDLQRWRDAAGKESPVSADTRRIALRVEFHGEALRAPLVGIGFIPAAQLDAATLRQRFGEPTQVLNAGQATEHWLYPSLGLAIALDSKGRELLQYVAPADFERLLRSPLVQPVASPASAAPA